MHKPSNVGHHAQLQLDHENLHDKLGPARATATVPERSVDGLDSLLDEGFMAQPVSALGRLGQLEVGNGLVGGAVDKGAEFASDCDQSVSVG